MTNDDRRLSEKLQTEVEDIAEWPDEPRIKHQHEDWASQARALEERVAAFETSAWEAMEERDMETARAEAAEAESMRVHGMLLEVDVQASRAEDAEDERDALREKMAAGRVVWMLRVRKVLGRARQLKRERDALRATLGAVRATVSDKHGNPVGPIAPAHILDILDKGGSLGDERYDLYVEVARLRDALDFERGMQCDDEHFEALRAQREELRVERDALRAQVDAVRAKCEQFYRSISESHDATALADAIMAAISDKEGAATT